MHRSASLCHSPPCHTNSLWVGHCEAVSHLRKRGSGRKISKKTEGGELEVWETAVPHEKEEERVLRAEWNFPTLIVEVLTPRNSEWSSILR